MGSSFTIGVNNGCDSRPSTTRRRLILCLRKNSKERNPT